MLKFASVVTLTVALFASCSSRSYWNLRSVHSGHSFYQQVGDGPVMVAFLRKGEIVGLGHATEEDLSRNMARRSSGLVSHPEIEIWRESLLWLKGVATSEEPITADEFVEHARGFPFDEPVHDAAAILIRRYPDTAPGLLDMAEELDFESPLIDELAQKALSASGVSDSRLARWLGDLLDEDEDAAVEILVDHPAFGATSLDTVFEDLDDIRGARRSRVFVAVAGRFATHPEHARSIADTIEELRSNDEAAALEKVLSQADHSTALTGEILRTLDERPPNDRARLFRKTIYALQDPPHHSSAIGAALGRLPHSDRAAAAVMVIEHPAADANIAIEVLGRIDDFSRSKRTLILGSVLDREFGHDPAVMRYVHRALDEHLSKSDRVRIEERLRSSTVR